MDHRRRYDRHYAPRQDSLGDIVFVELPKVARKSPPARPSHGGTVKACLIFTLRFRTVTATNEALATAPEQVIKMRTGLGWLRSI